MTTPTHYPPQNLPLLPFDVRPFHRETLNSYSCRLLTANFCDDTHRAHMTRELHPGTTANSQQAAWLKVLTTRTKRSTLHLDGNPTGWLTHRDGTDCDHFAGSLPDRIGCTLCSHGAHIDQHPHFDTLLCTTHHRWLGLWGTEHTQHRLDAASDADILAAHRMFVKLRRNHLIDVRLYRLVVKAIAEAMHPGIPINEAEPMVFSATIRTIRAVTLDSFARRFFSPATDFADAHTFLQETVTAALRTPAPAVSRAVWIYLRPTMLALRDTSANATGFQPAWEHDYPIRPQTAATLTTAHSHYAGELEPTGNYLAVTGDTPATAARSTAMYNTIHPAAIRTRAATATPLSFTCAEGHSFDYLPPVVLAETMTAARFIPTCGQCTERRVTTGRNDVQTISPAAAAQFDLLRNGGLTAADVANSSSVKYWWTCKSGHSHDVSPSKKTLRTYQCPICSNRAPRSGTNCLLTTNPEIAALWAGGWADSLSPATVTAGSNTVAAWRCESGHYFQASVHKMTFGTLGCTTCKKEQGTAYENCLAATHPDVASRWHPTKNGALTPRNVTRGERRFVWWMCAEGHEELSRIDKVSQGQQCSYCGNRRLKPGFNDLGTIEPVLSLELHSTRNRHQANEMFPSTHLLYWKCRANGHLHAQTTPNRRSSNGCPKCKPEERILLSFPEIGAA
jgi:hypothetical protein